MKCLQRALEQFSIRRHDSTNAHGCISFLFFRRCIDGYGAHVEVICF